MTSPLESLLKTKIAKAFKGKLTLGTLRRASGTTVNGFGDVVPGTNTDVSFEGIREDFTAWYKAQAGIPETDVSILILLGSLTSAITPKQDDLIYLKAPWNKWYKCRRVLAIDPAGASCKLQAYEVPAP